MERERGIETQGIGKSTESREIKFNKQWTNRRKIEHPGGIDFGSENK